jgi:hypothetical protein
MLLEKSATNSGNVHELSQLQTSFFGAHDKVPQYPITRGTKPPQQTQMLFCKWWIGLRAMGQKSTYSKKSTPAGLAQPSPKLT